MYKLPDNHANDSVWLLRKYNSDKRKRNYVI